MTRTWPTDWDARKAGEDCPSCARLGAPEHDWGVRVHEGTFADVYMNYRRLSLGYCVSVWKHGHVAELTDLTDEQVAGYWVDTVHVARAIEDVYRPAKLNFQTLGNEVTHLHTHIVPRYLDDAAPGAPLTFDPAAMVTVDVEELRADAARLRRALPVTK